MGHMSGGGRWRTGRRAGEGGLEQGGADLHGGGRRRAGGERGHGHADGRLVAQPAQPVSSSERDALAPWAVLAGSQAARHRSCRSHFHAAMPHGQVHDVIHWAEEGQRLRAIRGISDGARVQPVPELVAVAVKGGQHQGSVQNARQSHTGRQALPQPVQMVHVLLASHVQLLCRAVVAPCAGPRGRVGDRLVLFEHQVARVGVALRRLVVHEPHAPVTKALPLAKRVVGLVPKLVCGMHGRRPLASD
mmetsp:Transcript_22014/g.71022  ORF Transcript_22014/g.71022 Transcript_22014/m.71022 type:complete len:247 (+) Transcript_22014:584-1324(+)